MSLLVKDLQFSYQASGQQPVLSINHWSLDTGERVFVQGPSGSGKSTFLNLLCGMLPVSQGEISIFGERLDRLSARQRDRFRAQNIGYVFQQFNLIQYLDIVENVRLANHFNAGSNAKDEEIEELLYSLNIDSQHWRKPSRDLSIGQQQRVAIARAFINRPKLLIVDEPTSSLDYQNRDDFMSLLMTKVDESNATLIFVSHDKSLSHHFTRIDSMAKISASPEIETTTETES